MKKTNKLLSVLLTLALFASLLPFAALPARADSAPTGGYCGDADNNNGEYVAWQLVGGTLTVTVTSSVEGSMEDYLLPDTGTTAPWYASCTGITSVVIGSGVKTIGDYAFYGCTGVTSVVIPDSVTSIGEGAFSGCTALKYVFFPNTYTQLSIGENAFSDCAEGLTFYGDTKTNQSLGGITLQPCVTPATWSRLQTALNSVNDAAYIKLGDDVTFGEGDGDHASDELAVPENKTVLLDLNGHTINGSGNGSVLTVSGSLTLADCDRSFGSFGDKATGKITGGSASYGGGVCVVKDGTFHMSGGTVSGNTASGYGGGVYVYNGTFTLSGGTIGGTGENDKNTASDGGGGVYVSGTFTMTGGEISGNKTGEYSNGGGGVYVGGTYVGDTYVGGTFTMSGGTVSNNETGDGGSGGGVFVSSGTFTMSGGTVSGNKAHENGTTYGGEGGGVYVGSGATFTMSGSSAVSRNEATSECDSAAGGGVYVISGTFTMSDSATVSDNKAENGGGVCVDGSGSTFTMTGGTIGGTDESDANTATYGGVCVNGSNNKGTFTMSGGTVSGNTADQGGGVYVNGGAFTMSGGALSGNTANQGGGVFLDGTFTLSGGTVSGNTAKESGGVLVVSGTFRVSGAPVVRDNNGNNVKLNKVQGVAVTVAAPLTDGAALWIYAAENEIVAQAGDDYSLTDTDAEKFHGDRFGVGKLDENGQVRMVFRPELRTVGVADGKLTVTVVAPANSTLIAASYDADDRLTGVATTTFSERKTGTVEVSALPKNAARYRVFLVNGSYAPLCPAAAFKPGT